MSDKNKLNATTERFIEAQREYEQQLLKPHTNDPINHPDHYTKGIETTDYIESWDMDFVEGNIIKYVSRYKYKRGVQDLKKAEWYLKRLIHKTEQTQEEG
jgi:hypothetical protein